MSLYREGTDELIELIKKTDSISTSELYRRLTLVNGVTSITDHGDGKIIINRDIETEVTDLTPKDCASLSGYPSSEENFQDIGSNVEMMVNLFYRGDTADEIIGNLTEEANIHIGIKYGSKYRTLWLWWHASMACISAIIERMPFKKLIDAGVKKLNS